MDPMSHNIGSTATLEEADAAFAAADWQRASELYRRLLDEDPCPEALDRLGLAMWFLGDEEDGSRLRERSFAEYRRAGKTAEAANIAIYLAAEARIAGNASVANGWLGRGQRLLEGIGDCAGRGWLEVELAAADTSVVLPIATRVFCHGAEAFRAGPGVILGWPWKEPVNGGPTSVWMTSPSGWTMASVASTRTSAGCGWRSAVVSTRRRAASTPSTPAWTPCSGR
jgi:hypothetical protein